MTRDSTSKTYSIACDTYSMLDARTSSDIKERDNVFTEKFGTIVPLIRLGF